MQSFDLALKLLKHHWGFSSFRPTQIPIVQAALAAQNTLAILPTGGGKSICFQVPGLQREGLCLVISPLIALMQDQVENLQKRGLRARALTSGLNYREIDQILDNARFGGLDFLYTSPERIQSSLFLERFKLMKISLLVIDEAHCISEWGHDFRPAYRQLLKLREIHSKAPVLALTATATKKVQEDICLQLGMKDAKVFEAPFSRPNVHYLVKEAHHKLEEIISICKRENSCGIVYCQKRRSVKQLALQLYHHGIKVTLYHGGMDSNERKTALQNWLTGKSQIMVATNAFGMGIDKPDVRFVLHYEVPSSPEAYFQEAGRAGRDGNTAYALLLFEKTDLVQLKDQLDKSFPSPEQVTFVYRAVLNYLKVAVGAGKEENYDFDLKNFCRTFEISEEQVYYSLKILEQNGNLSLSEGFFQATRIQFIVNKEVLYHFQVQHESFYQLCTLLIRTYPGIFENMTTIHEDKLLQRLKIDESRLYKQLEFMQKHGIIDLNKKSNYPKLYLQHERLPETYLKLKPSIYLQRKEAALLKIESIQQYCTESKCRAQQLIAYFGQESEPCGHCDVCKPLVIEDATLFAFLTEPRKLSELENHFKCSKKQLEQQIRPHLLTEKIKFKAGKFYL